MRRLYFYKIQAFEFYDPKAFREVEKEKFQTKITY